jgi:hypothetical protein
VKRLLAAGVGALVLAGAVAASALGQASAAAVPDGRDACAAGAACAKGVWQVSRYPSLVRGGLALGLDNGDVLLVAGSGNDLSAVAARDFISVLYNPSKGTFKAVLLPDDFFCAGAVQLPDGKVLFLGGTKGYPILSRGYEGLNTSYLFNPATDKFTRENDLSAGAWIPSATELGDGDVIAFGGLNATNDGNTTIEYFKYNPHSPTDGKWLPAGDINQSGSFWGLDPTMILTQNGELFYTGSHVYGNNETPVGDNDGADGPNGAGKGNGGAGFLNISNILDPAAGEAADPVTQVNGLQDNPGGPGGTDMTDESMSVLLPPAQSQKVMLLGGGNINYQLPATRLTDLIDLDSPAPRYSPGPLLPRGTLSKGRLEKATDGKMYVSAVILPNGQVLETGGGLIDRADPVYEASMYNPATNKFTPMAADPEPRTGFSSAFLLPNGQVMAVGGNPGDDTYNERISIYSPPYLFHGTRPKITGVTTGYWTYGSTQRITVSQRIVAAELIRPASVVTSSDPNQRFVELPLTVSGNKVKLNVTRNPNIAPPGWYMLFVVNAAGVPSVARWVHVSDVAANR